MIKPENIFIIIPAKDEGPRIGQVLSQVKSLGYDNIVLVDDGSEDDTSDIGHAFGVIVIRHAMNLGAGAATQTGINYALNNNAEVIVTIDGDTQHDAEYIPDLINAIDEQDADLVIGSRFLKKDSGIPMSRIVYNRIANLVTWVITGIRVSDSQSGMRAITAAFARKSELHWNGFEFCIEQLRYAHRHGIKIAEVPIKAYYTKDTIKKGQNLITGIRMLGTILKRYTHL